MFTYSVSEENGKAMVSFAGDVDIDVTEIMEEQVHPALSPFSLIEIDFSEVDFVDSSGIGLLITLVQTLQDKGSSVQIKRVKPDVWEVFELLQLHEILGGSVFTDGQE
jgi:anti-sigma B factor antagonist